MLQYKDCLVNIRGLHLLATKNIPIISFHDQGILCSLKIVGVFIISQRRWVCSARFFNLYECFLVDYCCCFFMCIFKHNSGWPNARIFVLFAFRQQIPTFIHIKIFVEQPVRDKKWGFFLYWINITDLKITDNCTCCHSRKGREQKALEMSCHFP